MCSTQWSHFTQTREIMVEGPDVDFRIRTMCAKDGGVTHRGQGQRDMKYSVV